MNVGKSESSTLIEFGDESYEATHQKMLIAERERHSYIRRKILQNVAQLVCNPAQTNLQITNGVWRWNSGVKFPRYDEVTITEDGCLMLPLVSVRNAQMSIWMQPGELRVGVIIPKALFPVKTDLQERFKTAFDGAPCNRVSYNGKTVIIDWIFRDGFASFDHYQKLFSEHLNQSVFNQTVFIERLAGIIVHLYMAFTNYFYDADTDARSYQFSNAVTKALKLELEGDYDAFEQWMAGRGEILEVISRMPSELDGERVIVVIRMPPNMAPMPSAFRDQDGGEFTILRYIDH